MSFRAPAAGWPQSADSQHWHRTPRKAERFSSWTPMQALCAAFRMIVTLSLLSLICSLNLAVAVGQEAIMQQQPVQPAAAAPRTDVPCIGYLIGLGTQKGGSSSAWRYLYNDGGAHPRIQASTKKELNYFSDEYTGGSLQDYESFFNKSASPVANVTLMCPPIGSKMLRGRPRHTCMTWSARSCSATPDTSSWGEENYIPLGGTLPPVDTSITFAPFYLSEVSPAYLFDPRVPARLHALLPEARLFMLLRNPVDRAISAFNMFWQHNWKEIFAKHNMTDKKTRKEDRQALWARLLHDEAVREIAELKVCFEKTGWQFMLQPEFYKCLGHENHYNTRRFSKVRSDRRMVYNSVYADGLERWFSLFPAQSFLIWTSDDFKVDPARHMRDLVRWLDLDPNDMAEQFRKPDVELPLFHERRYISSAPPHTRRMLHDFFEPHNQRLFKLLRTKGFNHVANRLEELWAFKESVH